MRVLWGPSSQPGSLYPAIPVVVELVRRGHEVTALCDPPSETTFRALGCDFVAAVRAATVPPPARPLTRASKAEWWRADTLAAFADTLDVLRAERFDMVLADPLETGVGFGAEVVGVPCCSYVHWGLDECGPDVPFCFHLWDHEEPVDIAFGRWWNGLRAGVGLSEEARPLSEHRWYRTSPLLTLMLGLPELVYPKARLPSSAVRVGPTVWEPSWSDPLPDWVPTIGVQRPAVLGAVSTVGSSQDTEVLATLADATASLDLELVLTIPIDHQLPAFPGHVRVAGFVPHSAILEKVTVFVNHAGNGSVNRAACSGVPALLMPTGRDQFQVAKGAAEAGFAITLQPADRDLPQITNALSRLIHDGTYSASAQTLAHKALTYDAPTAAADLIEALEKR